MFRFSFIIPTLNEARLLPKLLASIAALNTNDQICLTECIVVDAGSEDDTLAIAATFGCRIVRSEPGNISHSRNAGATAAQGDILAFVDADCELPANWMIDAAKQLSESNTIAVGMSMSLAEDSGWIEKTWFELAHRNHREEIISNVYWLPTFNLAVTKQAFDLVGGFDEALVTCEDYELGQRLYEKGSLVRIETQAGVIHHGESKTIADFYRREGWRARGEISLLKMNSNNLRIGLSFMLPIMVVGCIFIALTIALLTLLFGEFRWYHFAAIMAFGVIPTLLLVLRKKVSIKQLVPSWVLLNIYYFSRAFGTFGQFDRVTR